MPLDIDLLTTNQSAMLTCCNFNQIPIFNCGAVAQEHNVCVSIIVIERGVELHAVVYLNFIDEQVEWWHAKINNLHCFTNNMLKASGIDDWDLQAIIWKICTKD
ncbi:hypothetical protein ACJX0J_009646 [Zea mays]